MARIPWFLLASPAFLAATAHAACNIIPSATKTFRGALGYTDRPFAAPEDFVTVNIPYGETGKCAEGVSPFLVWPDPVVTLVFTPPNGPKHVVVLTDDCTGIGTCAGAASTTCLTMTSSDLTISTDTTDTNVQFRFPDTDALVGGAADERTLSGPVTIAVKNTRLNPVDPIACEVVAAANGCVDLVSPPADALTACIDDLFNVDGSCNTADTDVHEVFGHFTALPPHNDYQQICDDPMPPCLGTATEIRFTTDAAGNVLIPMDWSGVIITDTEIPVPRLLRSGASIEAFSNGLLAIIPSDYFLTSYTPEGALLPPVFEPQTDESAGSTVLFGSADAPTTVLRIRRRGPERKECAGGTNAEVPCKDDDDCPSGTCVASDCHACAGGANAGLACERDADCPASTCGVAGSMGATCATDSECGAGILCGPTLFDFADRYADGGIGPVLVVPDGDAMCMSPPDELCTSELSDSVVLEGFTSTDDLLALTVSERVAGSDYNGDADATDYALTVRDRGSGTTLAVGDSANGRAVSRVYTPPFSFPMVAASGNVVAFAEPEPLQNTVAPAPDKNQNGRQFEQVLRVYRIDSGPTITEVTSGPPYLTVEPRPIVGNQSIAVSSNGVDQIVYFRQRESSVAQAVTTRVSIAADGTEADGASGVASMSITGRYVAFESDATNLLGAGADTNGVRDVFVYDRDADDDGAYDETGAGETAIVRVSVNSAGTQANGASGWPSISYDGRYVAFESDATNLLPGDTNGLRDVFVHDRDLDANGVYDEAGMGKRLTVRVSVDSMLVQAMGGHSGAPSLVAGPNGYSVAFESDATNLVPGDSNGVTDVFVRLATNQTIRMSVNIDGVQGNGPSRLSTAGIRAPLHALADNGDVAFSSTATNLLVDGKTCFADRDEFPARPPCDTNGVSDVFASTPGIGVRARASVRVKADGSMEEANGPSDSASTNSTLVAFASDATNLVVSDSGTNGNRHVFVHDRDPDHNNFMDEEFDVFTDQASLSGDESEADGDCTTPLLHNVGLGVVWASSATNLTPFDTNGFDDAFYFDASVHLTDRSSVDSAGVAANGPSSTPFLNGDTRFVSFSSTATNLVMGDTNGVQDVFVRGPDTTDLSADVTGNGLMSEIVLVAVNGTTGAVTPLCPAEHTAVAAGSAAFLRPEFAGNTPSIAVCPNGTEAVPGGGADLNADSDENDEVVHLWTGSGAVQNYRCAATSVALSSQWVAATVSESGEGVDLNGDGDTTDAVLKVHPLSLPAPANCAAWTNAGEVASNLQISEPLSVLGGQTLVAFITLEQSAGDDLNGDGDELDRVLQFYNCDTGAVTNVGHPANELVMGETLIAFGTSECQAGVNVDAIDCERFFSASGVDLNGDGDADDDVLRTYDLAAGTLIAATPPALTPCFFEACDPRQPYRVYEDTIRYLTYECDQGGTNTVDCKGGGTDLNSNGSAGDIVVRTVNVRTGESDAAGAADSDARSATDPLKDDPLADGDGGTVIFHSLGHCVEDRGVLCTVGATPDECKRGTVCEDVGGGVGHCVKKHRTCEKDADCPGSVACRFDSVAVVAADEDGDKIPDHIDNCPLIANAGQQDFDADGQGDVCDQQQCGNGLLEGAEACESGDDAACPGLCRADCTCPCGTAITDPERKIKVKTKGDNGRLTATFIVSLGAYSGESVEVRLDDTDSNPIAQSSTGTILPNASGTVWKYKVTGSGLKKVKLKDLGGGNYLLKLKAKEWFTAAQANQSAAATQLTVTIGSQCFTAPATVKID